MSTLYRRYRPQTFGDIAGQSLITTTLSQAIAQQQIAHGYLFYGPRGTGKTTTARVFAKRLNCLSAKQEEIEPCGTCASCVALQENKSLDVIEIDAASNRGIDDIRALRESIAISPVFGKYKVYIIDEVHMLTNEAFAALLKTLEEPQAHAVFILATTELHKVPATILSRCQVYRFRRATPTEMKTRLLSLLKAEKREIEDQALDFIVSRSDGCYRDGESLLGQILTAYPNEVKLDHLVDFLGLPSFEAITKFLDALLVGESAPALQAIDEAFAAGHDPEQFIKEAIVIARNRALAGEQKLTASIRALLQALQDLAFVPQPFIALQLVVLTVCTTKGAATSIAPAPVALSAQPAPVSAPAPKPTPPPAVATVKAESVMVKPKVTASLFSLDQAREAWPKLIDALREAGNPVASTFLRAIEPASVEGAVIIGQASYALHRTYFDKPENRKLVETHLTTLLGQSASLRCIVSEQKPTAAASATPATSELLDAVKEVFG